MTVEQLELSIKQLTEHDIVIAPAEDGGYMLIGMDRHCDDVFQSMPWGTGEVLGCTREKIVANKLVSCELESCWDIDRVEDYFRYKNMGC